MIPSLDSHLKGRMSIGWAVVILLVVHACLLGWMAARNSPTMDETAHLPAGLSHWKSSSFALYRVNPPLVRSLAAIPLLFINVQTDWAAFSDAPYSRSEFAIGNRFVELNGAKVFFFFTLARWICIPLSLLGGFIVFLWARALYGSAAGLLALVLWTFSPNVLGNSAMITPDGPAASLGVAALYFYWCWLKQPTWPRAIESGIALGFAELTKTTWIVLFALLPLLWLIWRCMGRRVSDVTSICDPTPPSSWQLAVILLLSVYVINLGYGFEGSFTPLRKFSFVSHALGGPGAHETPANRFSESWLGKVPVPVPANYLMGIDIQRYDFERGKVSYLRGVQQDRGWWYWYIYALAVKVPVGTWILCLIAGMAAVRYRNPTDDWRDALVLLSPAVVILVLVSSQTGFSRYLRYVLPMAPFCYVWVSQTARAIPLRRPVASVIVFATVYSVTSSLTAFPHSLSYFNEIAGGPLRGADHLLDANIDWGQDLLFLKRWHGAHPKARPFYLQYFGFPQDAPRIAGLNSQPMPKRQRAGPSSAAMFSPPLEAGWYAISVNDLYGYRQFGFEEPWFDYLLAETPTAMAGYSIRIFHLSAEAVRDSVRRNRQNIRNPQRSAAP